MSRPRPQIYVWMILATLLLSGAAAEAQPAKVQSMESFAEDWTIERVQEREETRMVVYSSAADTLWGYYSTNDSLTTYKARIGDTLWVQTRIWGLRGYSQEDLRLAERIEALPDRDDSGWPDLVERLRWLRTIEAQY